MIKRYRRDFDCMVSDPNGEYIRVEDLKKWIDEAKTDLMQVPDDIYNGGYYSCMDHLLEDLNENSKRNI